MGPNKKKKVYQFLKGKKEVHQKDLWDYLENIGYKDFKNTFRVLKYEKVFSGIKIIKAKSKPYVNATQRRRVIQFLKNKKVIEQDDIWDFLENLGYKNFKKTFRVLKSEKYFDGITIIPTKKKGVEIDSLSKKSIKEYSKITQDRHAHKAISWWLLGHSIPYWKKKLGARGKYSKLTPEIMQDLVIKQGGCCYYTGLPLRPFKKETYNDEQPLSQLLQQVSIDKLTPKKGYVKGNIVLASFFVNKMKGQCTLSQFKTLILLISKRLNFNEQNHLPDKDLTRIIDKINKTYLKRTMKNMKKIKKLHSKNLLKAVKKFPGKLTIEKGKLIRTN